MLKAYKGNRVIRIEDVRRRQYEAMGYTIKTMDGKTISAPVDKDAEIKELKEKIAHLQKELEKAQAEKGVEMEKYMNKPISENGISLGSNPAEAEKVLSDEKPARKKRAKKEA